MGHDGAKWPHVPPRMARSRRSRSCPVSRLGVVHRNSRTSCSCLRTSLRTRAQVLLIGQGVDMQRHLGHPLSAPEEPARTAPHLRALHNSFEHAFLGVCEHARGQSRRPHSERLSNACQLAHDQLAQQARALVAATEATREDTREEPVADPGERLTSADTTRPGKGDDGPAPENRRARRHTGVRTTERGARAGTHAYARRYLP